MRGKRIVMRLALSLALSVLLAATAFAQECVECHKKVTPGIVSDWQLSKHSKGGLECSVCHGKDHKTALDVTNVKMPTLDTCAVCHMLRVQQFKSGKHAIAWASMKTMPTTHWQPMVLTEGMKGCGGCHKIGLKSEAEINQLRKEGSVFGNASCDACHTRHTFSVAEARQPQACRTCHMGIDHPQWEMYSASKHGVRYLLKQNRVLPENTAAPTCQTCHMKDGDHAVMTAWGFLAVRLPMPDDKEWAADRAIILQGLGVLDPSGNPTPRLEVVKAAKVARLTQEEWQKERDKMTGICNQCHSVNFAKNELAKGDQMIKEADHLMAEGLRIVASLYKDGILEKPKNYPYPFPDLLAFHDAPTVIEQKLFLMFLEHRMRAFQGTFHANPDYALWYGWSEMTRDLTEIKMLSQELRRNSERKKT